MAKVISTELNGNPCLLVEVEKDNHVYRVHNLKTSWLLTEKNSIPLPPGNWTTARKVLDITKMEAESMVEMDHTKKGGVVYANYLAKEPFLKGREFYSPISSLHSFIRSEGMEPEETVIIF